MSTREPGPGTIAIRVPAMGQLFDALDPATHQEKDLSPKIDEYIVESAEDLPGGPFDLTIHLDQPGGGDEERLVGEAIRAHFSRRARSLGRKLRRLLRRGLASLAIGLAFLIAVFLAGELAARAMGAGGLGILFRESLLIVGWVAMWRPLEIFLYDWWPIAGERRLHDRLSRITVRVVPASG
ncbi:MAG TPA: hypothetical protein VLB00_12255 [Gemmatimonadales bacterium]|nr:hypothetical protein [Gemmatimonadales bacterium]